MSNIETYIRKSLQLFAGDPPDNSFQHGFLEALLVTAVEGCGINPSDPDVVAARDANKLGQSTDPKVARLSLVNN